MGALAGMGCKGARIPGLVAAASATRGPAGLGLPHGMPPMPAGGMAGGMPSMPPGVPPGAPAGGRALAVAGGGAMPGAMAGAGGGAPDLAQLMAAAQQHGAPGVTPEQASGAQAAMAAMQQAMQHPLTRPELLEVFDELARLGVLTDAMRAEARDCVLLAPPGSDASLGGTGAVLKAMVLPQLRTTHERLASLAPEEQDQLAAGIADALRAATPADRQAFEDGLGQGFFPPAVVEKVRAGLR
jgi:hypothetical protein